MTRQVPVEDNLDHSRRGFRGAPDTVVGDSGGRGDLVRPLGNAGQLRGGAGDEPHHGKRCCSTAGQSHN